MAQVVESFETQDGTVLKKTKDSRGEERWRTESGEFRSSQQVEAIKQNSARRAYEENDPSLNVEYRVTPSNEQDRKEAIRQEYGYYNRTKGLNPNKPDEGGSFDNRVRGWMENETLRKQVKNDPLIDSRNERQKALEAKARQVANDLQNASSERDAIEILRKYNIY